MSKVSISFKDSVKKDNRYNRFPWLFIALATLILVVALLISFFSEYKIKQMLFQKDLNQKINIFFDSDMYQGKDYSEIEDMMLEDTEFSNWAFCPGIVAIYSRTGELMHKEDSVFTFMGDEETSYSDREKMAEILESSIREKLDDPPVVYIPKGYEGGSHSGDGGGIGYYQGAYKGFDFYVFCSPLVELNVDGEPTLCFVYYGAISNLYRKVWESADFARAVEIAAVLYFLAIVIYINYYDRKKAAALKNLQEGFASSSADELESLIDDILEKAESALAEDEPKRAKDYVAEIHRDTQEMNERIRSIQNKAGK